MICVNLLSKSLNEIYGLSPQSPALDTYVIRTACAAMQKPLHMLTAEEIRLLIGQKTGLRELLPLAVGILREEPWIQTCYYAGDLLEQCRRLDAQDWHECPAAYTAFQEILTSLPEKPADD